MRSVRPQANGDAGGGVRRRRHVAPHHFEHLEEGAVGQPRGEGDAPAATAHPGQLRRGRLGTAREHHSAGGDHGIERPVRERQRLGVAQFVADRQRFGVGARRRRGQQVGGDVHADHLGAAPGHQARRPAGAGGQIEDPFPGLRVEAEHAVLDGIGDPAADSLVVGAAGAPHRGGPCIVRLHAAGHRVVHRRSPGCPSARTRAASS